MQKKFLLLSLLLVFSGLALAQQASVVNYDPLPAKAGKFVTVYLGIENRNQSPTGEIRIELQPRDGLRLTFGEDANKNIGIVPQLQTKIAQYRLEVTRDAIDGTNTFDVRIFENNRLVNDRELSIEVENKSPSLEIGQTQSTPQELLPDTDNVRLQVKILNTGDDTAENVRTRLELPSPLEFSDAFANQVYLGNLAANTHSDATYLIDIPKTTPGGTYHARLVAEFTRTDDPANEFIRKDLDIELVVKPVPRFEITNVRTNPEILTQGDRGVQLTIELKNVGDADAENVRAKIFQKSEQPFEFDNAFGYLAPKLEPGQSGEVTFELRIKDDAPLQEYLLELEAKNFVDDTVRLETHNVPFRVSKERNNQPDPLLWVAGALLVVGIIGAAYWRRIAKAQDKKTIAPTTGKKAEKENGGK